MSTDFSNSSHKIESEYVRQKYDEICDFYRSKTENILIKYKKYMNGMILDIGCGKVCYKEIADIENNTIIGLDFSLGQIKLGKKLNTNQENVFYVVGDMNCVPLQNNKFNVILAIFSIVHVNRIHHKKILERFYSLLKPNGILLIHLGGSELEGEYKDGFFGSKMYFSHFDKNRYSVILNELGFNILEQYKETGMFSDYELYLARKV